VTVAATTAVKICGLTRAADAAHARASGVNYLGVILASGPRLLDVPRARAVFGPHPHASDSANEDGVRDSRERDAQRVAVFGAQSAVEVVDIVQQLTLDVVQLHGDVTVHDIRHIAEATGRAVWPVLRVDGTELPSEAEALAEAANWLVLDAKVRGQLGGTGVVLDWSGLAESVTQLRRRVPGLQLVLAGGLRPTNVGEAIRLLAPDVVDVSSGVETAPGVKDPAAVEQFVTAVRTATGIRG